MVALMHSAPSLTDDPSRCASPSPQRPRRSVSGNPCRWHEVEITEIPPLKPNELSLLQLHGLLNVLNVLRGELSLIGLTLAADDALLRDGLAWCAGLLRQLHAGDPGLVVARQIGEHERTVFAEIDRCVQRFAHGQVDAEVAESLANLRAVFEVLRVRAREVLARAHEPEAWEYWPVAALGAKIEDFAAALAGNSHGRFRIVTDPAQQRRDDYHLDLQITAPRDGRLVLPAVLGDVISDLLANARKYTAPGGRIRAVLHGGRAGVRLIVEDNGRGIPPDELASVVQFGRRASNVGDVRTMGGGFGLTKAFFVAKQFGGRFWLASKLGQGTRVRLEIPARKPDLENLALGTRRSRPRGASTPSANADGSQPSGGTRLSSH